ncbi:hypothetical protein CIB84_016915, partial [Bambusicola thoracicus]
MERRGQIWGERRRFGAWGPNVGGQGRVMGQMNGCGGEYRGCGGFVAMATPGHRLPRLLWQHLQPFPPVAMAAPVNQTHRHGNQFSPTPWLLWQHPSIKASCYGNQPFPPVAMAAPVNQTHRHGNQFSPTPCCYGSTCQSNPSPWQPVLPHPLRLLWQHLSIKPIAMATSHSHPLVAMAAPANQTHHHANPSPLPPPVAMATSILPLPLTTPRLIFSVFFSFFLPFLHPNPPLSPSTPPGGLSLPPPKHLRQQLPGGGPGGLLLSPPYLRLRGALIETPRGEAIRLRVLRVSGVPLG